MTVRVSVCGIDGSGKSTSISDVVNNLSANYSVLKVGRPMYYQSGGTREYLFSRTTAAIDNLHAFFDAFQMRGGILIANAINVLLQPLLESRLIRKLNPDITIASRDMSICPAVYAPYYFHKSIWLPIKQRMEFFGAIRRGGYPNLVVYLDTDPMIANERISERIKQEEDASTERAKWRHLHENPQDLKALRETYQETLPIIQSLGVKCAIIETTSKPREEVVSEIQRSIETLLLEKK